MLHIQYNNLVEWEIKSGGQREFVEHLARAAVAVGVAAVFMETHPDPDNAPSDGPVMLPLSKMQNLLKQLVEIDKLVKNVKKSLVSKLDRFLIAEDILQ